MDETVHQLLTAIKNDDLPSVKEIIARSEDVEELCDADIDDTNPIYLAAELGRDKILKLLLQAGADPYSRNPENGFAPIHIAVKKKHIDTLHTFLEIDKEMGDLETDSSGKDNFSTALHLASECEDPRLLALLLVYPGDRNKKDFSAKTPMWRATHRSLIQNVTLLLQAGADPTIGDTRRITPLMVACTTGHYQLVMEFLKYNFDLNSQDESGDTALHHLAQIQVQRHIFNYNLTLDYGRQEMFFQLLLAGADPLIRNHDGDTSLDVIEIELADVYDFVLLYKLQLCASEITNFKALRTFTDALTLSQHLNISLENASVMASAIVTCNTFLINRDDPNAPPCTLINTETIPNKRKFKHSTLNQPISPPEKLPTTKKQISRCPFGFSGPNPHSQGHPGYESPQQSETLNSGQSPPNTLFGNCAEEAGSGSDDLPELTPVHSVPFSSVLSPVGSGQLYSPDPPRKKSNGLYELKISPRNGNSDPTNCTERTSKDPSPRQTKSSSPRMKMRGESINLSQKENGHSPRNSKSKSPRDTTATQRRKRTSVSPPSKSHVSTQQTPPATCPFSPNYNPGQDVDPGLPDCSQQ